MLTVTEPALSRLIAMLGDSTYEFAVRILTQNGKLKLRRDIRRTGDVTFHAAGRTVLLLDSTVSESLAHRVLDIRETREGPRLRLQRPLEQN